MRLINKHPGTLAKRLLALLPFVVLLLLYLGFSSARLAENPDDKMLPGVQTMGESMSRLALEPSKRTGEYLFFQDTVVSLKRLGIGISVSAVVGLVVGVLNGMLPLVSATFSPFVRVLSMIPPMALLPILFIAFGVGEFSKYALIAIGTAPFIMRELEARVTELPNEQLVKAQTLDATTWQIAWRIVLPQVTPRLLDAIRLSLGAAWLFLIAAEAIAATEGLGYRIFLVRRYLSMDVIIPYVIWIALLAYIADLLLRLTNRVFFPWYGPGRSQSAEASS